MTPGCPTDLALERHLIDPASSPLAPHLAGCESCRARLARMEEEGERFRRFVFPATVDRVEEAARRRSARWWIAVLAPVPVAAVTMAVILAILPSAPRDDYVGIKGGVGVRLTGFVRDGEGARAIPDGGTVPANASLRLRVQASAPCRLFVISIDDRGTVSRLEAGGVHGLQLAAGQHDLPGGVELDGAAGPERLFAVCVPEGASWPDIEKAGRAAAAGGARAVRGNARLGGLPAEASQSTLLLEKTP